MESKNEITKLIYKYDGNVNSSVYKMTLEKLRQRLNFSLEEYSSIESIQQEKYQKGQLDHQKYEKIFLEKYKEQNPIPVKTRQELRDVQKYLDLTDEDIELIENKVVNRERSRPTKVSSKQKNIPIKKISLAAILLFLIGVFIVQFSNSKKQYNLCSEVKSYQSNPQGDRRSIGSKFFIQENDNESKENIEQLFKDCDFQFAQKELESILSKTPNDPEALIYLNNANVADQPNVKIVTSVPIESNPDAAQEILRGVAQAQKEVNESNGINGTKLVVEIASDDSDADIVKDLAPAFVKDRNILAVVGHRTSGASLAGAPIYEEEKLVAISPTSTSPKLSEYTNYVLRTVPSDSQEADKLRELIYEKGEFKNVAICVSNSSAYSTGFKDAFEAALKQQDEDLYRNLISHDCNLDEVWGSDDNSKSPEERLETARELLEKMKEDEDEVEALLLVPSGKTHDAALVIAEANQGRLPLFAASTLYQWNTLDKGGKNVEGMILATPWHPDSNRDSDFADNAGQLWGAEVTAWRTASAYDATWAIIDALKDLPTSTPPTREALQETLFSERFSTKGASYPFAFNKNGDTSGDIYFVKIVKGDNDKYRFQFIP
ncbi:ABC transporter substrate-binding protein [Roseofilum casamattae]|uniref:ABC transporter substrate-binding protein n=1 Tax=Roseofilum casamattae BLCC-M143 TaxID=3022442 RepID=A0ABT7BY07_9CYAN|nr:ABC transporter substrate-binding protein [Roseofilum casamattae]MDJ1183950.1 ABC transporter substrate-binding protein [Roseofilum casamattae BLCC-M143]